MHGFRPLTEPIGAPAGASAWMREIIEALNRNPIALTERDALKIVEEPWKRLKAASPEERLAFVLEALEYLPRCASFALQIALKSVLSGLFRAGLPVNSLDALRLVELVSSRRQMFPYKTLLGALANVQMTPALREALLNLRGVIDSWHGGREMQEIHERIDALAGGAQEKPLAPVSSWTREVFREIDASPNQMLWRGLLMHARSLTQSSAPAKWQKEAVAWVDKIGRAEFFDAARRWLALGPMPGVPNVQLPEDEGDYQKGFIWTLGALGATELAPEVADFAFTCFRKIPQIGAVSHRVGNACVNALAAMPGLDAVTQLSRLAMRVKYDVARRLIEKGLAEAAERNHVSRDDLEAMSVPAFGLTPGGARTEAAGSCEARLAIEDGSVVLSWFKDGKALKSAPAEVKTEHADALKNLTKAAKDLQAVLSTQRLRLERQLLTESFCRFENWKAWYQDHPVTSFFARRLIWEIATGDDVRSAIFDQGRLCDWAGNPVRAEADSRVRLWHPIRAGVQEVLSWRCWLEDHGVRQPFKQAHREVYLLTDAERETGTYSNRFAAHIVRQHQFSAVCRERGWQFNLMGEWDSHNTPWLELPRYNLRAEFHVDFSEGAEVSGHMIYRTICTDRVQFLPNQKRGRFEFTPILPVALESVPPVVFSEVMRDIDLLVGVTSIGADPSWGTEHGDAHAEYWNRFADGELSIAAENRKGVLQALLPKLAIADRCRIDGRYLFVRGASNQYRIHLGSGNVIMEPGSRYLCIVRGPGDSAASLPLPFDGDAMLGVILSKAFLLAADAKIKDPAILNQIRATGAPRA